MRAAKKLIPVNGGISSQFFHPLVSQGEHLVLVAILESARRAGLDTGRLKIIRNAFVTKLAFVCLV